MTKEERTINVNTDSTIYVIDGSVDWDGTFIVWCDADEYTANEENSASFEMTYTAPKMMNVKRNRCELNVHIKRNLTREVDVEIKDQSDLEYYENIENIDKDLLLERGGYKEYVITCTHNCNVERVVELYFWQVPPLFDVKSEPYLYLSRDEKQHIELPVKVKGGSEKVRIRNITQYYIPYKAYVAYVAYVKKNDVVDEIESPITVLEYEGYKAKKKYVKKTTGDIPESLPSPISPAQYDGYYKNDNSEIISNYQWYLLNDEKQREYQNMDTQHKNYYGSAVDVAQNDDFPLISQKEYEKLSGESFKQMYDANLNNTIKGKYEKKVISVDEYNNMSERTEEDRELKKKYTLETLSRLPQDDTKDKYTARVINKSKLDVLDRETQEQYQPQDPKRVMYQNALNAYCTNGLKPYDVYVRNEGQNIPKNIPDVITSGQYSGYFAYVNNDDPNDVKSSSEYNAETDAETYTMDIITKKEWNILVENVKSKYTAMGATQNGYYTEGDSTSKLIVENYGCPFGEAERDDYFIVKLCHCDYKDVTYPITVKYVESDESETYVSTAYEEIEIDEGEVIDDEKKVYGYEKPQPPTPTPPRPPAERRIILVPDEETMEIIGKDRGEFEIKMKPLDSDVFVYTFAKWMDVNVYNMVAPEGDESYRYKRIEVIIKDRPLSERQGLIRLVHSKNSDLYVEKIIINNQEET